MQSYKVQSESEGEGEGERERERETGDGIIEIIFISKTHMAHATPIPPPAVTVILHLKFQSEVD